MKKILIILFCAFAQFSLAQSKQEGIIVFETKRDIHASIPKENEQMKARIPQFSTMKFDLNFNAQESLFKINEDDDEDENEGNNMRFKMMRPNYEVHINTTEKKKTEMRGFMGKDYLIEGDLALQGWKLTDETAKIAGYDCKKATCTNKDNKAVIAWYAETIPVSTGPMSFGGLPGMILKVDIDNSITVCEAKTIKFKKLGKTDLLKPTKGKKVTEEEFKEEMKKLMQENKGMRIMTGN